MCLRVISVCGMADRQQMKLARVKVSVGNASIVSSGKRYRNEYARIKERRRCH